ncbi:ribonucleases P/MRP protein subunit POP1 [Anoplopoma fimbria]|uniref:ribonucleases P/MRP protein subunit POP1 n=1 Tax=Anoplopoma fimbria TaxID=229290 RepID=UPI0023EBD32E|nr:ribonucleases P/MRP protein subunit POP1 [Anoplopoma fimbria]XP_054476839.1 ribonucleases P/MRP protein subunit POP1 [Anoplopoma fimbria]XP_054476840.1 ribonucleases P/MRP protein subunit POP1 [Anoplopoma fimbria]
MSAAKVKMREKKMRNQPASVQYPSVLESSTQKNGGDTPVTGGGGAGGEAGGAGPSGFYPNTERPKNPHQRGGWVRGHQRDGGGYAKEMPKYITAGAFARARAAEVSTMLKAVTKTTGSCHVFGALPKHMRRRAMSHNTKRLPCRLRDLANRMREKSLQGGKKKEEAKSKSRKARRRHGNLLLEFNRRQRKNMWLETHIWHAKRFHMVKKWGYCLGDRPTYKCYRSSYRAMSSHCLLQDLSYYCCIELHGEEDKLLASLSQLTSKEAGPTFAAALSLSGQRQGSVVVYRAGQYPMQPLGPVTFLWRPRAQGSTHRQLWIWAHPTTKQDLLLELQTVCQCCEAVLPPVAPAVTPADVVPAIKLEPKPESTPKAKQVTGIKRKQTCKVDGEPPAKKILGDGTRSPTTPVTWKSSSNGIVISDLTMEIVRYRLIGPQSHSFLAETIEAATNCDEMSKSQPSSLWWPEHCKNESKMDLHQQQADVFQLLKGIYSTGDLPSGTVLGLNVDDPRLTLPTKKVKALPSVKQAQEEEEEKRRELMLRGVPAHCCQSNLWERSVRENVTDNKISEQELNRMKSEVLVPGSRLSPTPPQGRVPILLVHQPGKQVGHEMSCWGAGWDLLLPKGWGMAFWVPLTYRGVRIGGLTMSLKHSQNKGAPHFPHDYPDCPAGVRFQEEQEAQLLHKFKRNPPAKRTNYIKHGCLAPFCCPWQQLSEEWELILREGGEEGEGDHRTQTATEADAVMEEAATSRRDVTVVTPPRRVTVLRNRKSLRLLSGWCRPTTSKGQRARRGGELSPLDRSAMKLFLSAHGTSLVWVRLRLLSKGKPELHAMVCVPTTEDLKLLDKESGGGSGPQEPTHRDHFKSRIRRRKKGPKRAAASSLCSDKPEGRESDPRSGSEPNPTTSKGPKSSPQSTPDLTFGLWPDPLPSVTSHCSRVTLGWVTQGDFSLSAGCGEALGFVSVAGLLSTLFSQPVEHRGTLLLRNPASLHYRFTKVNLEV